MIGMLGLIFRSWGGVVVPIFVLAFGVSWAVGWMLILGKSLDIMSVMQPTLFLIVGLSAIIHFLSHLIMKMNGGMPKDLAIEQTPLDASIGAASGNEPFDTFTGTIDEGGSSIASVTSFNLSIDNGLNPTYVIGAATSPQMEYGLANVSGTITAYFTNETLIEKFINETESELELALTDGLSGNTYTFSLPRVKYTGATVPVANAQSRILTLPFVALLDTVTGTNLTIAKS
jgi:hypothetical protein